MCDDIFPSFFVPLREHITYRVCIQYKRWSARLEVWLILGSVEQSFCFSSFNTSSFSCLAWNFFSSGFRLICATVSWSWWCFQQNAYNVDQTFSCFARPLMTTTRSDEIVCPRKVNEHCRKPQFLGSEVKSTSLTRTSISFSSASCSQTSPPQTRMSSWQIM